MPGSIVTSGGGGGVSSAAIQAGINKASDIDLIIALLQETRDALQLLAVGGLQPLPTLQPKISGAPGQEITAQIEAPGVGRSIVIQIIAWYDSSAANGKLVITGTDSQIYLDTPISNRSGLSIKIKLGAGLGCEIAMASGGNAISGHLNYAISTESA